MGLTPDELLGFFERQRGENILILGTRERRVTLYSQQVRALNLVYALFQSNRLRADDRIAVIGGGVAGVTVAAGASICGCEVMLYEQKPELLHLQQHCDTRWVHPHIYDWPYEKALEELAELPILSWRAGRSADVADTILEEFTRIYKKGKVTLKCDYSVRNLTINTNSNNLKLIDNGMDLSCKAIVIATGFGLEQTFSEVPLLSYWRNDAHGQPSMADRPVKYLISGTGDGGLIDLLRVRIDRFRQDRIVEQLFPSNDPGIEELLQRLRKIKPPQRKEDEFSISEEFAHLKRLSGYIAVKERIRNRLREDTNALLHGQHSSFANPWTSMLHSFLVTVLHDLGEFTYSCKEIIRVSPEGQQWKVHWKDPESEEIFDHVIIRHGPKRVNDKSDVSQIVEKHEQRLAELKLKDFSRNYDSDLTANRLEGNDDAWWYGRGADRPAPPPSSLGSSDIAVVPEPRSEQPTGGVLHPAPGRTLAIYRDLDVSLDWFQEIEQDMHLARLDSRLLYYGPGLARGWKRMTESSRVYQYLEDFLKNNIGSILENRLSGSVNVVDLGIGNSVKAHDIVRRCYSHTRVSRLCYIAVDISYEMLVLTLQSQVIASSKLIDYIRWKSGTIVGINSAFTRISHFQEFFHDCNQTLFLLLGNTLGNERLDAETLSCIADVMRPTDLLLTEVQLVEDEPISAEAMVGDFNTGAACDFYTGPHRVLNCTREVTVGVEERSDTSGSKTFIVTCSIPKAEHVRNPAFENERLLIPHNVEVYLIRKYSMQRLQSLFTEAGLDRLVDGVDVDPKTKRKFAFLLAARSRA